MTPLPLHPEHRADLEASGLTDATMAALGFRSLPPGEWGQYVNHPRILAEVRSVLLIPYPDTDFYRVKLFPPVPDDDGHHIRYYQPGGTTPRLYIPPRTRAVLANPAVELVTTEGEKKAAKADQDGIPTLGLGGLWTWLTDGRTLPDFDGIDWCDRSAPLVPDGDVWTRPDLRQALYALGRVYQDRGAQVVVVKFPAGQKLDTFLMTFGLEAYRALPRLSLRHKVFTETAGWWKGWREERAQAKRRVTGQGRPVAFPALEPWDAPVDGAAVLDAVAALLRRFVVMPDAVAHTMALLVAHAHVHDASDISPIAVVTSPTKRCGKTTLLTLVLALCPKALATSNISAAALFRSIEAYEPTLVIDEADSFAKMSDELRGLLNAGHTRDLAYVVRTVGDEHEPRKFTVWCPKFVALIGRLPDTVEDRAIILPLERRGRKDRIERLQRRLVPHYVGPLPRQLARWAQDHLAALRAQQVPLPDELHDRAADNWEPLLGLAAVLGGPWPERARTAVRLLSGVSDDPEQEEAGVAAMQAVGALVRDAPDQRLSSADLVEKLTADPTGRWAEYAKDKPLTQRQLAWLLGRFGIKPKPIRVGEGWARGYTLEMLETPLARYSPPSGASQASHVKESEGIDPENDPTHDGPVTDRKLRLTPCQESDVTDVTLEKGVERGSMAFPAPPPPPEPCWTCRGRRFWRSVQGRTVCARCHPPATPNLVAEWLGN
jgi:hypothetical protein